MRTDLKKFCFSLTHTPCCAFRDLTITHIQNAPPRQCSDDRTSANLGAFRVCSAHTFSCTCSNAGLSWSWFTDTLFGVRLRPLACEKVFTFQPEMLVRLPKQTEVLPGASSWREEWADETKPLSGKLLFCHSIGPDFCSSGAWCSRRLR